MPTVKLSAGTIEYTDTGGSGQVIVPLHGLMMDGEVWRHIVDDLRADFRCVVPTLPLGAHRFPMRADADLSLPGFGTLISEFLDRLDLADVTVVGNDWGGAVLMAGEPRVRRLVLTPCEAFDNWPPGVPGRLAAVAARMPGGLLLAARGLRMPALRRLPMT
ncbi:MAG: alpha/beta fold hydrolase, partial [Sciscionella sp.]